MKNYVDILSAGFPSVTYICHGDPHVYENIAHVGDVPIPPKAELDAAALTIAQRRVWLQIQAERDRRTSSGVRVGPNWFHSDQASRIQQLGLVLFGANMPPGIMWKTLSGSFVQMTPTLAVQIFQSIAISDQTFFGVAEHKRAEMMALEDPDTYSVLTGWPATYEETQ